MALLLHKLCAGPAQGGTAGVWHRLFPCPLCQRLKEPLSRQLNPQADSLLALCQSNFPWRGGAAACLPCCWRLTDAALFQSHNSQYLNSQHSDGKSSCQVHVHLKGVQDHGVAALGKTKHGEIHLSSTLWCSHSRALARTRGAPRPGTTSTDPSHHLTQPHGTGGRGPRHSAGEEEGVAVVCWEWFTPLTNHEEV